MRIDTEVWLRFIAILDERLMDIATTPKLYAMSVPDYEQWQKMRTLNHVRNVHVVRDCVAGAWDDAAGADWEGARVARDILGLW